MQPAAVAGLSQHLPMFGGDHSGRPTNPGESARLLDRLIEVAGCVPDQYAAPTLTVLAHVAWHQGNGAVARVALDRARAAEPGYFLAALLDRVVTEGMRPRAG